MMKKKINLRYWWENLEIKKLQWWCSRFFISSKKGHRHVANVPCTPFTHHLKGTRDYTPVLLRKAMIKRTFTACTHTHIYIGSLNIQHINLPWNPNFFWSVSFWCHCFETIINVGGKICNTFLWHRHIIISGQFTHLVKPHNIIINFSAMRLIIIK